MVGRSGLDGRVDGGTRQRTAAPRRALDWLLRNRHTGRWTLGQRPNVPLVVALVAMAVHRFGDVQGTAGTVVAVTGYGALLVWAGDEIVRGVNPFRRLLGTAVAVGLALSALARWTGS